MASPVPTRFSDDELTLLDELVVPMEERCRTHGGTTVVKMRRARHLLTVFAAGIGTGAMIRRLRGPDAPVFREPWPADRPWPPIEATRTT